MSESNIDPNDEDDFSDLPPDRGLKPFEMTPARRRVLDHMIEDLDEEKKPDNGDEK